MKVKKVLVVAIGMFVPGGLPVVAGIYLYKKYQARKKTNESKC